MSTPHPVRPPRVVIADDHEWIREIIGRITRDTLPLAEVIETADGQEALEAFRAGPCDFLISNHAMPKMNGMELIRAARLGSAGLPILMVSVHPSARKDALDAGANWFLTKEEIMDRMPPLLLSHTRGGV